MLILSHRGYWKEAEEKNSKKAFIRSFSKGFGTETDVRDHDGLLVISHDLPDSGCITFENFLETYSAYDKNLFLALNIKADGLQFELVKLLEKYNINNYFVFDMSVPDGLVCIKYGLNSFTRQSEYEKIPSFYEEASGVWLDEFKEHWITEEIILKHLNNNKKVCIVSPELHKRDHIKEWEHYKEIISRHDSDSLMLCTDIPEDAKEFFYGED